MYRNQNSKSRKRSRSAKGGMASLYPHRKRARSSSRFPPARLPPSVRVSQSLVSPSTQLTRQRITAPTGAPDKLYVKLRAVTTATATNTGGGASTLILIVNNMFDYMGAAGSQQPYLFDQWAAMYDNYRVHGVKYKVTPSFGPTGITSTATREIIVIPSRQGSAFASSQEAREQPRATRSTGQINCGQWAKVEGYIKCHAVLGVSKTEYNDTSQYSSTTSAGPGVSAYLHIMTFDPFGSQDVNTNLEVELTFFAEFFSRKTAAIS